MKKTKIICTLGPASDTEKVISAMAKAGMNVARINASHGSHEEHAKKIAAVKKVREKLDIPLAVMLDTKGPEFRIGTFEKGRITLAEGDTFAFTTDDVVGNEKRVSVSYKGVCEEMHPGDRILLNNGLMIFEVTEVRVPDVICRVLVGGEVSVCQCNFFTTYPYNLESRIFVNYPISSFNIQTVCLSPSSTVKLFLYPNCLILLLFNDELLIGLNAFNSFSVGSAIINFTLPASAYIFAICLIVVISS